MSRPAAFSLAAALFLSGIAIGGLGMHVVDRHHMPPPFERPHDPRVAMEHLDRMLGLTAEQREKVAEILDRSWRDGEEIRRELQPRVDRHIVETHRQIMEILTPEQRERFDEHHHEHGLGDHRLFVGPPGFPAPPPGPGRKTPSEGP